MPETLETLIDPRDQSPEAFTRMVVELGFRPESGRKLVAAVLAHDCYESEAWSQRYEVPKRLGNRATPLPRLLLDQSVVSQVDGFQKLRFLTADQLAIETVIIPLEKPNTVTLCLSSQVGCAMSCVFCATARMNKRRNLATWEIVDQFVQARAIAGKSGKSVTGVVFMGMGEPFLNYNNVIAAAELFRCSYAGKTAAKSITISTVGLVPEIKRFTLENHNYRLSISLGAATDAKRAELVPIASRTPVAEVIMAAREYAKSRNDRVMLSYVCISGVNVGVDDAIALGKLIGDTPVRLDLIDVTDPTGKYLAPTNEEMSSFRDALTEFVGQPVVRRYSGGKDIQAACGTLAGSR